MSQLKRLFSPLLSSWSRWRAAAETPTTADGSPSSSGRRGLKAQACDLFKPCSLVYSPTASVVSSDARPVRQVSHTSASTSKQQPEKAPAACAESVPSSPSPLEVSSASVTASRSALPSAAASTSSPASPAIHLTSCHETRPTVASNDKGKGKATELAVTFPHSPVSGSVSVRSEVVVAQSVCGIKRQVEVSVLAEEAEVQDRELLVLERGNYTSTSSWTCPRSIPQRSSFFADHVHQDRYRLVTGVAC